MSIQTVFIFQAVRNEVLLNFIKKHYMPRCNRGLEVSVKIKTGFVFDSAGSTPIEEEIESG